LGDLYIKMVEERQKEGAQDYSSSFWPARRTPDPCTPQSDGMGERYIKMVEERQKKGEQI
jgi:hypothetical protein